MEEKDDFHHEPIQLNLEYVIPLLSKVYGN